MNCSLFLQTQTVIEKPLINMSHTFHTASVSQLSEWVQFKLFPPFLISDSYKRLSLKYPLKEIKQSELAMPGAHTPYLYFKALFLAMMIWKLQINTHQFPVLVWCEGDQLSKSVPSTQYVPVSWTGECFLQRGTSNDNTPSLCGMTPNPSGAENEDGKEKNNPSQLLYNSSYLLGLG